MEPRRYYGFTVPRQISFFSISICPSWIRRVPVLVLSSGLDEAGLRQTLLGLRADRLLQKPIRREELLGAMQEVLATPYAPDLPRPVETQEAGWRLDPRVAFTVPIRIRTGSSQETLGRLCDLSAGGLGAYLPHRLARGETITVSLDIKGRSLALRGFVKWAGDILTAIGYRYGVCFIERQDASFPLYAYSFFRGNPELAK
jgi:hypothetical protein